MTSHYTCGSVSTLHAVGGVLGRPLDTHFLLGSHHSMVTALGSCVKWPLILTLLEKKVATCFLYLLIIPIYSQNAIHVFSGKLLCPHFSCDLGTSA